MTQPPPRSTLFPYTTLFRSSAWPPERYGLRLVGACQESKRSVLLEPTVGRGAAGALADRKSTRLNSSHLGISYAVFCLKKKKVNCGLAAHLELSCDVCCARG